MESKLVYAGIMTLSMGNFVAAIIGSVKVCTLLDTHRRGLIRFLKVLDD